MSKPRDYAGRDVPCPHEGDEPFCERCWASHEDAVPYCTGVDYKQLKVEHEQAMSNPEQP